VRHPHQVRRARRVRAPHDRISPLDRERVARGVAGDEVVGGLADRKTPKHSIPIPVMKAMAPFGPLVGKLMGQPPNMREMISSADGVTFWASHEKASRELGYSPRGMEEGLRATLEAEGKLPAVA